MHPPASHGNDVAQARRDIGLAVVINKVRIANTPSHYGAIAGDRQTMNVATGLPHQVGSQPGGMAG